MNNWILDNAGNPAVNCRHDYMAYYRWHEKMPDSGDWYVKKTGIGFQLLADEPIAGVLISTVYLGSDHGWSGERPVLWETMVFCNSWSDEFCERYSSQAEARRRHAEICRLIASEGLEALTNRSEV